MREGFTAGHAAYRTLQIAQGSPGGGPTCDSMPAVRRPADAESSP